jgi:cation transporter-like permease
VTLVSAIQSPLPTSQLAFVKRSPSSSEQLVLTGKKRNNNKMAKQQESSSALSELKETIKSQKAEIDKLRAELSSTINKKKAIPSGGHASHGSTNNNNDEILEYKSKTSFAIASERVGWLALFLFSLSFTAIIMNGFEHTLSKQIELAYFVPLMAGHGGNTGGQAVGTVLSALSAGVITKEDAVKTIGKEGLSGLFMGTMLGCFIGPISHYGMGISVHVATVVSVTFPLLSTIAALLGSSLPFVCVILGLDPAVIAAPAMTSFVDVSGLLCYFMIANKIFRLFGMEL